MADDVVVSWPGPLFEAQGHTLGPRDAVCILTHDPKFDVPAVQGALATKVGYIGGKPYRTPPICEGNVLVWRSQRVFCLARRSHS
jgi:hypothetical protein